MKHIILLVEGKRADRPSFMGGLSKKGYQVESVPNGVTALKILKEIKPKAIIIDAESMRTSGTRICTSIRKSEAKTPIILIVAEDEQNVNMACVDEILKMPFTVQKLSNRLKPFMTIHKNEHKIVGPIKVDLKERWVHCNGKSKRLTPRLFTLLNTLLDNPGEVLLRDDLFRTIWETDYLGDTRSLDVHISWLRQAIEKNPQKPVLITTERGIGYKLNVEKGKQTASENKK